MKWPLFLILVIISGFIITALMSCSTAAKVVEKPGSTKYFNVEYGAHKKQKMDVFVPEELTMRDTIIFMVHGGGWRHGDKRMLRGMQNRFLKDGFATVNINYRLIDKKINITQQLQDLAESLSASDSFFRGAKYIMLGESAGAHLSLLYGYKNPDHISKIISLSGPTDFTDKGFIQSVRSPIIIPILNKLVAEKYRRGSEIIPGYLEYSPVNNVANVPTLIVHGRIDPLVSIRQAYRLDAALSQQDIPHKLVVAKFGGHLARLNPLYKKSLIFPEIRNFIMN